MTQTTASAEHLLQCGQAVEAVALLRQAVDDGSAQAAAMLGDLRLSGAMIRRDLAEARAWFGRAVELGLEEVEPVYIALLANGAGGSGRSWPEALALLQDRGKRDDWAARQCAILAAMDLTPDGDPKILPERQALNDAPRVETLPGFLSGDECRYLIDRAEAFQQPSTVVDQNSGRLIRNPIRTASSASFPFVLEDPALHAINRRIAVATGASYEHGEPLQVLRYRPGEEYKLHSDTLPPGGDQRVTTLLVSLGTDFEGGETTFPHLGLKWRGETGEALIFDNVDKAGLPERRAWHAGAPVTHGAKYLLSKWIRRHPLDLSGPPGRPL